VTHRRIDLSPRAVFGRLGRWALTGLFGLALLVGAFYLEENWRGRAAWMKYKRQLEAKGERLDWAAYVEKSAPEEENFTQTPLLAAATDKDYLKKPAWRGFGPATRRFINHIGDWTVGKRTDLEACEAGLADNPEEGSATNVLGAFKELEPALNELRKAVGRPYAQFKVPLREPWAGSVPHLPPIRQLVQLLSVHASAELAANHPERALEDIQAIHRIVEALRSQPSLVSAMIRVAILGGPASQPIWEGIVDGKWSEAQLEQFQRQYATLDLIASLRTSICGGERAAINELVETNPGQLRKTLVDSHGNKSDETERWKDAAFDWAVRLSPSGWGYQNQLFYNRIIQEYALASIGPIDGQISPRAIKASGSRFQKELQDARIFGLLAAIAVPNFHRAIQTSVRTQTQMNELLIACALERHRRLRGNYPDTLDALVPSFLKQIPRELIEGQSFKYEKLEGSRFVLYSIGWDQKDDGGFTASDRDHGDWVWHSMPVQ
jgi:hypothetical protein